MKEGPPLIDKELVRQYVGLSSFQKGERYALGKAISLGKIKRQVLTALCQGHEFDPYKVEVIFNDQGISQSYCSCPVGAGGKCKHIAALLLSWIDYPDEFADWKEIRRSLESHDSRALLELIDLLEEKVEGSADVIHAFQQHLNHLHSPYLARYLKRIEEAFETAKLPWYHPNQADATAIAFALGKIRSDAYQLILSGHIEDAVKIHQALIQQTLTYLDRHHDSWGMLGEEMQGCVEGLREALASLEPSHELRAKILRLLFKIVEEQIYREETIGAEEARDLLVRLSTPEEKEALVSWVNAIQISKKEEGKESAWLEDFLIDLEKDKLDPAVYLRHYRETGQLVKLVDNLLRLERVEEARLVVQEQALGFQSLTFANLFLAYKQNRIAEKLIVDLVEKQPKLDLLEWLKNFYLKEDRKEEALESSLRLFYLAPCFTTYQTIEELAHSKEEWNEIRQSLLDFLKDSSQHLLSLEIYLDEKKLKQAIEIYQTFLSQKPGLLKEENRFLLVLRLAAASRHKHPSVSVKIYEETAQELIEERTRDSYRRACDYLKIIREIYQELGTLKKWNAYLKSLVQTYNRLTALKDELMGAGLIG